MSQPLCFDIEYWRSYGPFKSKQLQWSIMQNIYYNFFNFQYNNIPLRWLSTALSTSHFDYSYSHIYDPIVEDFAIEIHHGHLHFFILRCFFNFCLTLVILFLPGTFHFLTEPGIFCCVDFEAIQYYRNPRSYVVVQQIQCRWESCIHCPSYWIKSSKREDVGCNGILCRNT